ncbi:hypothetical protein ADUPG1_008684, partial [Aduncisulcus paluster]
MSLRNPKKTHDWQRIGERVPPTARYSPACCVDEENEYIFVFGGFCGEYMDDFLFYDVKKNVWRVISPYSDTPWPSPRRGHSLFYINGSVILFGGEDGTKCLNDVWKFNIESMSWTELTSEGEIPEPRYSHGSVTLGNVGIVFGGRDRYVENIATTSSLELPSKFPISKKEAGPTDDSSAEAKLKATIEVPNVSPGSSTETSAFYSNTYLLSIERRVTGDVDMQEALFSDDSNDSNEPISSDENPTLFPMDHVWVAVWKCLPSSSAKNSFPSPRYGASMTTCDGDAYLYGGYDGSQRFADLWKLNVLNGQWESAKGCESLRNNSYLDAFYSGAKKSELPVDLGSFPCARTECAMFSISSVIFVFGGSGEHGPCGDIWMYDSIHGEWDIASDGIGGAFGGSGWVSEGVDKSLISHYPVPRHGMCAVGMVGGSLISRVGASESMTPEIAPTMCSDSLIIFGGSDGEFYQNDMWKWRGGPKMIIELERRRAERTKVWDEIKRGEEEEEEDLVLSKKSSTSSVFKETPGKSIFSTMSTERTKIANELVDAIEKTIKNTSASPSTASFH